MLEVTLFVNIFVRGVNIFVLLSVYTILDAPCQTPGTCRQNSKLGLFACPIGEKSMHMTRFILPVNAKGISTPHGCFLRECFCFKCFRCKFVTSNL